jgi:RecA/RadA recombinase
MAAVELEMEAARLDPKVTEIGRATFKDREGATSLFRIPARSEALLGAELEDLFLAHSKNSTTKHIVQKIERVSAQEVVVNVDSTSQIEGLRLFHIDSATFYETLLEELKKCSDPHLAANFCLGHLSQAQPLAEPGFNPEQQSALGAICASGLTAVWGPPGTGKTKVIGAASARLIASGHTVAIVSITNVAVDQALLKVFESLPDFRAGQIVRVGLSTHPEVLSHPHLTLAKATELLNSDLVASCQQLEQQLRELDAAAPGRKLSELQQAIAPEDRSSVYSLDQRRLALQLHSRKLNDRAIQEAEILKVKIQLAESKKLHDSWKLRRAEFAPYQGIILRDQNFQIASEQLKTYSDYLEGIDARQSQLSAVPLLKRKKAKAELGAQRTQMESQRDNLQLWVENERLELRKLEENGVSAAKILQLDRVTGEQGEAVRKLENELQRLDHQLAESANEAERLADNQPLTEAQCKILEFVDSCGGAQSLGRQMDGLKKEISAAKNERAVLTTKIQTIKQQLAETETRVAREAQVVGTTFAQLLRHRGLQGRLFDHVIVDEASFALSPYVLAALARATTGASLIGDFAQNLPIFGTKPAEMRRHPIQVQRWLNNHCFQFVGVHDPVTAVDRAAVLRAQYRYGENTMALANSLSYGGLLRNGRAAENRPQDDPEIMIIDADFFAGVDRSADGEPIFAARTAGGTQSWLAGAFLSNALAKRYKPDEVGIVTPYTGQVSLTKLLTSAETAIGPIGTVHSFQGREFPTVIFDLVHKSGQFESWALQDSASGSRIFNVAITRNTKRLFLIMSASALGRATTAAARELLRMVDLGDITVIGADEILGRAPMPSVLDQAFSDATATRIESLTSLDDVGFYASLDQHIDNAAHEVTIYSPFVTSKRTDKLLPSLIAARNRGVRIEVFSKPRDDPSGLPLPPARYLTDHNIQWHYRRGMHEKVVIIDQFVVYAGSLNVLSNNGRTTEFMLRTENRALASALTAQLRGEREGSSDGGTLKH